MERPPRVIEGGVGCRPRVVLGRTGSEWLLLVDEDANGSFVSQTKMWSSVGLPVGLAQQINIYLLK